MSYISDKIDKAQSFTTIDQCLNKVSNRFELAVVLARRATEIDNTTESTRKSVLTAIEQLQNGQLNVERIKENIITGMRKNKSMLHDADLSNDETAKADETDILDNKIQQDYIIDNEHDLSLSEEEMNLLEEDEDVNFKR